MKSIAMLDDSQSNTVVITTVGVLKSAFLEWADELAQSRKEAGNDVGMPMATCPVINLVARISTSNRMLNG